MDRTDISAALVLDEHKSIRDAMALLCANAREVVLVRDAKGRISGLITDGDIRRGLLAGATLQSPVTAIMHRDFFAVGQEVDRAAVLDLMKARRFQHVPVLDGERRLIAVHFLRDLIGAAPKPNIAVVMAGGKGTRLRPISETVPKPMVEVAGRPILERIILHLVGNGIHTVYLAVNYKAEIIEKYFGDGSEFGCTVSYLRENEPRGTGGPLSLLPIRPQHPIIVLNGDQVMHADLSAMLDHHCRQRAAATIAVGPHQVEVPFGTVVENGGRLIALQEKPTINFLVNRGIYVLEPEVLDAIPPVGEFPITALFESLLADGKPVGVFYFDDYWLDVGRPTDLRQANGLR
jgi:dTDP-glucose pyrophosphorylase/CBS domain-containing protein